jgi:hypothetical protein
VAWYNCLQYEQVTDSMSFTYLDDRSVYEERYDKTTVALCRDREAMVEKCLGARPTLNSHGEAETGTGYYQYSIMYFSLVEALAGERWQEREETIRKWMTEDVLLLADRTTEQALAWIEAIKAEKQAQDARKRPQKPGERLPRALSGNDISIFVKLAGRSERPANPATALERLLEALMEPGGREARRRAAAAIKSAQADRG